MRFSIYDFGFGYIKRFCNQEPSRDIKLEIMNQFSELLVNGWTEDEISKVVRAYKHTDPTILPSVRHMFSGQSTSRENLLVPNAFYYHPELRILPPPAKRDFDYNTGIISKAEEEYFLEMRASYTLHELIQYFVTKFELNPSPEDMKRYIGGFKYLLKQHNIDTVLFMVDAAHNNMYTEDNNTHDFNPIKLADYRTMAEDMLNWIRTDTKRSGDDHVVPRKRILSFGNSPAVQR
jgi:hypothetical protein